ncbi:MAG TPA: hypothetical protein PL009_07295 [Flavipsychrobacter sp.]|nr:hypothetical protein [Flavipsychrobacter sp.]
MKRLFITLLFIAPFTTIAQEENSVTKKSFLSLGFFGGLSSINASSTNAALTGVGLPSIPSDAVFNMGGVLAFDLHNMVFNDITFNNVNTKSSRAGVNLRNVQYNIDFNINYTLFHYYSHFIYPSLGFGWQSNELRLRYSSAATSFTQSLNGAPTEKTYNNSFLWYFNPRISYDYALGKKQTVFVGVKVGYRIGINNRDWNIQENSIDGPKMNASGYFVHVGFTVNMGY